ncbi:MAG: 2-C-methyl-D-erythritol 4-phosphate cytidylyltransferase [Oscillospiraceae bacterium]|nr:2-C-methyl-D-erythritol 4-phosphate cytidylyltransferase [Oscillospiraceae bacterium]
MINGAVSAITKLVNRKLDKVTAVIVAAGKSTRMEGVDKIFAPLGGEPLIVSSIKAFENCSRITEIILVLSEENCAQGKLVCEMHGFTKVKAIIPGGKERSESSYIGIQAADKRSKYIIIHDGARPFVTEQLIVDSLNAAVKRGAAAVGVPVTSTIKKVKDGLIVDTVDRIDLYEIQTPQVFRSDVIKAALKSAIDKKLPITDDCMAVEAIGLSPKIVLGTKDNIKITVREDLVIANAILKSRGEM